MRRLAGLVVAAATVATAFTLTGPAGTSSAADDEAPSVTCDPTKGYLKVKFDSGWTSCYTGRGVPTIADHSIRGVTAGVDDVVLHDENGDAFEIKAQQEVNFTKVHKISKFEIIAANTPDDAVAANSGKTKFVECNRPSKGYLKVRIKEWFYCFSGDGKFDLPNNWTLDEVQAGVHDAFLYDANGDVVKIDAWQGRTYNSKPIVKTVENRPVPKKEEEPTKATQPDGEHREESKVLQDRVGDENPGGASDIRAVTCDTTADQLKLKYRRGDENGYECFTGVGKIDLKADTWISEVHTGDGDVKLYDVNGTTVDRPLQTAIQYPNRPANIKAVEILPHWTSASFDLMWKAANIIPQ